jgi:hypothetical protein
MTLWTWHPSFLSTFPKFQKRSVSYNAQKVRNAKYAKYAMKVRSLLLNHGLVDDDNLHHFNETKQNMISYGERKEDWQNEKRRQN